MKKTIKKALSALTALCLAVCLTAVTAPAYTDVYTVVKGDSLWKIAVKYKVGLDELIAANPQFADPNLIYPGQKVYVPLDDPATLSFEEQVVELVNAYRAQYGLSALTADWELARVARVVARVESDEKRDRTMLDSAALEFLDADGHAITDSSITVLEGEQVEVTIPVLKLKEVPLKFEFSNVPAGYDPAELNASISPATIRIAGAADTVDGIESVNAGFINLARVQLGKAETLKIQLSEGLVNVDDVQEATVTFDTSGYGEPRAITVSDIRVVNAPSGVDVKVITESINNVTLVGEAEELAAISPSDVIAQVDASAQNITVKGSGQQQFSAQIIVTGTKTVFATGAYSVLCDITVK